MSNAALSVGSGAIAASSAALSVGSVTLKVTPEQLVSKADLVITDVTAIKQAMATIKEKMDATKSYWIGEAGEMHRQLYYDQQENIDDMMKRLDEHPRDLKTIAGNYTTVENSVSDLANSLRDNVIS